MIVNECWKINGTSNVVAGVALILLIAVLGPTAFLARSVQILVSLLQLQWILKKMEKLVENGAAPIVIANWKPVKHRTSFKDVETNGIVKSGSFNLYIMGAHCSKSSFFVQKFNFDFP